MNNIDNSKAWNDFINDFQQLLEDTQLDLVKWDCDVSMKQARALIWEKLKEWMEKS